VFTFDSIMLNAPGFDRVSLANRSPSLRVIAT
jgi:hypothetical protein